MIEYESVTSNLISAKNLALPVVESGSPQTKKVLDSEGFASYSAAVADGSFHMRGRQVSVGDRATPLLASAVKNRYRGKRVLDWD